MHFKVEQLPGRPEFGAIVRDLAPESLSDPATRKALHDLWIDRGLIIFKKMEGINTHLELSSVFGEPEEHPLLRGVDMPREHKLIIDIADGIDVRRDGTIDYESDESDVYEIDGELRAAFLPWHTDLVYVDEINHGGIIRPVTLPKNDGQTGFIDQIEAYSRLPRDLAERIENLSVIYRYVVDASKAKYGWVPQKCLKLRAKLMMAEKHNSVRSRSIHPMVYAQEGTRRKVLNVSPWFAENIEGMDDKESDALLREVISYCTDKSRAYFHSYELTDMVLWDNWRMLHCANGMPAGQRRHMRRTTIAGDYGRGRFEKVGTVASAE
jgi:taurine dioxygenase